VLAGAAARDRVKKVRRKNNELPRSCDTGNRGRTPDTSQGWLWEKPRRTGPKLAQASTRGAEGHGMRGGGAQFRCGQAGRGLSWKMGVSGRPAGGQASAGRSSPCCRTGRASQGQAELTARQGRDSSPKIPGCGGGPRRRPPGEQAEVPAARVAGTIPQGSS